MIVGGDIKAVEGREGWLFLSEVGDVPTLDGFRDLDRWRQAALPKLVTSFTSRARRMAARGVKFIVVLPPEATGIYPDMLPDGIEIETPTMAEQLAAALNEEGVDIVCPAARLRGARGPIDIYQRLDSHWTDYGAFLCYREIVARLKGVQEIGWRDVSFSIREGFGDLGVHAIPDRSGPVHDAAVLAIEATAGPNVYDNRVRSVRRHTCPTGVGRALVFRDSFASALVPYLERTFAETILVGGSPAMPDDAITHFAPDVVILEVAERSLLVEQAPFADWPTSTFEQMHYERTTNAPGGRYQTQSRAALDDGKIVESIAAAAVAIAREGAVPRLHNLGHALLVAGQADPALLKLGDELCAAAAPTRDDRTLHWLHSQFAYMRGREPEARIAMARALALQPDNAQYLYSLAVWDYLAGDPSSALATMRRSLEGAPLHKDSWRIALECARAIGAPDSSALQAEAERLIQDLGLS